ncbi:uncharacterized protein FIESC28_00287 [Fusarium coffeatum]|uniref:Uncharacterized protein n=1 Tax=Fusarium coffeatum TaxID=231269 RepID=A0A366SCI7_9HYPO|nr:uncharacterized protein FIESC28_00287 [Fusarium coffeatum]RBR27019.1 hypothetical protein FIESC28_00287 [Fusarium coffeatum]
MQNIISRVPSHLSKVLYITKHDNTSSHFAVYAMSEACVNTLAKHPMGSENYKVELTAMHKPNGERPEDDARFLVDVADDGSMCIRERTLGSDPVEAEVSLPTPREKGCSFKLHTVTSSTQSSGYISHPLPGKIHRQQLVRYPYLTLSGDHFNGTNISNNQYEWQVHPTEKGPLRYELVDLGKQRAGEDDDSIMAIYHHNGFENELPGYYSSGVLLLPSTSTSQFDIAVVSSLLAVLSAVRQQPALKKKSRLRSLMACL